MEMRNWISIVFILSFLQLEAQDSLFVTAGKKINGAFIYLAPDGLGNLFAVTKSGQLRKYNALLDSVGSYNELKQLGRLQSIASFNALKTGVFFSQYKTILVLDRFLREINRIDLRKTQLYQVNAVGQSFDNKWWVYDEQDAKLKKIGDNGKAEMETADLRLLTGENASPIYIFDHQRNVFVYDPEKGLFIFDQLGAFKKKLALIGWNDVQPFSTGILGVKDGKMLVYAMDKLDVQEYVLPSELKVALKIGFTNEGCFALYKDSIVKYTWALK
jgi:hypothetical protein